MSRSGNTVTLTLFDRNFNALAADGPSSSDGVAWTAGCDSDGAIAFQVEDQAMDQIHPGVLFTSDGSIGAPAQRGTWTRNMDYFNSVTFTGTSPQTCTINAMPHRSYDPGAPGFEPGGSDPDVGLARSFSF